MKPIHTDIIHHVKQACLRFQSVANASRQKRQEQAARNYDDIERLDRLRNPSKYLGK
jgi:hypothetical protein